MSEHGTSHLEAAKIFVATASSSMALLDLEGRLLEVSPPVWRTLQTTREDMLGRPADLFLKRIDEAVAHARNEIDAGSETSSFTHEVVFGQGERRFVRRDVTYCYDASCRRVALLVINNDVTAERLAEQQRNQSESLLRAILENIPGHIAVQEVKNGRLTLVSGRNEPSTQLDTTGWQGHTIESVAPAFAEQSRREMDAAIANDGVYVSEWEVQGRVFRVRRTIFTDGMGCLQSLSITEDITELKAANEAATRAAAEAEAANRAKSEFLANMSHEIRTPLNGVLGVAGALAGTPLSPAQLEMVSIVETSAKTLEALLSDILDLARIEAGRLAIEAEAFDLRTSVAACGALFEAAAAGKGLELVIDVAPEACGSYVGDAARIRQVLSNLLGNAVKFTEAGRIALRVSARQDGDAADLRFEVRDTGIGFDAAVKARLFSRFEQGDGSITRRFGGSGLGLAISRALAEQMGGALEGDSVPGEGAVFTFALRLPRAAEAPDSGAAAEKAATAAAEALAGFKVLLAEDHPTNRRVVELILGAVGVDLTCVENGAEAVQAFRDGRFDLVLMDMQMPVMGGVEAVCAIRAFEAEGSLAPTPVYMLSANAMVEHARASIAAGADGHLTKPIAAQVLLKLVGELAVARREPTDAAA